MGQYFKAVIEKPDGEIYALSEYGMGKFMEWGYMFNSQVMAIVSHLATITKSSTVKYYHAGDYSELAPVYETAENKKASRVMKITMKALDKEAEDDKEVRYQKMIDHTLKFFLYNHTKKEMVSLREYITQEQNVEIGADADMVVSPLAFLCATEQGLGGGDFRNVFAGSNMENGGRWLGDDISVSAALMSGFENITSDLIITEDEDEFEMLISDRAIPLQQRLASFGQY